MHACVHERLAPVRCVRTVAVTYSLPVCALSPVERRSPFQPPQCMVHLVYQAHLCWGALLPARATEGAYGWCHGFDHQVCLVCAVLGFQQLFNSRGQLSCTCIMPRPSGCSGPPGLTALLRLPGGFPYPLVVCHVAAFSRALCT